MKADKFPLAITEKGVSALIRKATKIKGGQALQYFIVEYILNGKRKQVWRSDLDAAKDAALEGFRRVANGQQTTLELKDVDRLAYTRAIEILAPFRVRIDAACRDYDDALHILDGKASVAEACRDWVKLNSFVWPRISVSEAAMKVQERASADKKSKARQHELDVL